MSNLSAYQKLESAVADEWKAIFEGSPFVRAILSGDFSAELYQMYMTETYHYTFHNSRNQALVGVFGQGLPIHYQKFVYHHACEETGHEMMALHDLNSIAKKNLKPQELPAPLCATEALVGYLYWISFTGNPLQRLGYSFWAENSYQYVNPLVEKIRDRLSLKNSQLTFFVAHSDIDDEHAKEVQEMITQYAKSDADWRAIEDVARKSLKLTGKILDEVWEEYRAYQKDPGTSRYRKVCEKGGDDSRSEAAL